MTRRSIDKSAGVIRQRGRHAAIAAVLLTLVPQMGLAQQDQFHESSRKTVVAGMQAVMICNGLFVSERTLEQIYAQELKLNQLPFLPPSQVDIDRERRAVTVGARDDTIPTMHAVFREGFGVVVLAPHQTLADIDELPTLQLEPLAGDPAEIPWPDGDLVSNKPLPAGVSQTALDAAGEWAFDRETHGHPSQITLSLLVVHKGDIVYERYAPGVNVTTKTRTWSTAKSIASTLIGLMVDRGQLALDEPLPVDEWLPRRTRTAGDDPRRAITLRHVLNMSSGLYPVDNQLSSVIGSSVSYFAGTSSVAGALDRGLVREPGTIWDYQNFDNILGILALKQALGDQQAYHEFPRRALFDKIGMRNTLPGVDRFGDFVMSSQVYTNARDLARFGLLYVNDGQWNGEQILSKEWIEFVRTPAPSTKEYGKFYGGQFWLVRATRTDVPADAYTTAGNRGNYTVIVPSHKLVIVRRGLDWLPGQHEFSEWDLTREVLKAFGH